MFTNIADIFNPDIADIFNPKQLFFSQYMSQNMMFMESLESVLEKGNINLNQQSTIQVMLSFGVRWFCMF